MNMRILGNTGLKVSELCFGTMTFGGKGFWKKIGTLDQKAATKLVDMAIDGGVNFFDTADVYSEGVSEEMTGMALGARRKDIILATKVRGRMGPGPNQVGLSRHHILQGCDESLRRLGTDYIDLYQVHNFDPVTPLEETLRALDDLVRAGKVRYIGCSNYTGWQLMKAMAISEKQGLEKFVTLQAYYSVIHRDLELELVPLCLDQGLGVLPWSPMAGGFLSGKYRRGKPRPGGSRRTKAEESFLRIDEDAGYAIIDALDQIAASHQATIAQAALNYLLRKPSVCALVIGARTPEQLEDNLKAAEWEMTPEEVAQLDELSPVPHVYPYWFLERTAGDR